MQLSANTSGLTSGITEAEKLINKLGRGAEKAAQLFDKFRDSSGALPPKMQEIVDQAGGAAAAFRDGSIVSEEFAEKITALSEQASAITAAFQEGAAATKAFQTEAEANAAKLERYAELMELGAISAETFARAQAELAPPDPEIAAQAERQAAAEKELAAAEEARAAARTRALAILASSMTAEEQRAQKIAEVEELNRKGAFTEEEYRRALADATTDKSAATAAEAQLAKAKADAEAITRSVMTAEEKYAETISKLEGYLKAGTISEETFSRATAKAATELESAGSKASEAGLKLNELSGFFSLLPGPIGNVAGRISGFASTISGIEKLVQDPTAAISNLSNVFSLLTSPIGLAVAGVAAFGAAATAIASGLNELSGKVEQLSQEAEKIGASFEFLQVLDTAAQRSGASVGTVAASFKGFLQSLNEVNQGKEETIKAFEQLGLSAQELASISPEDAYKRVASALAEIESPTQRAALATEILGKQGLQLLSTFKNIPAAEKDMARFFDVLSEFDKIRFEQFDASVEALTTSTGGLQKALITPFVGLGDGIARGSAEFVGGITAIVKPIGQILEPVFTNIGRVVEIFLTGLGAIGRTIGAVLAPFGEVASFLSENLIGPFYEGFQSIITTMQGAGEAAVNFLMQFTLIGVIADNLDAIKEAVTPFIEAFVSGFQKFIEIIGRVGTIISTAFSAGIEVIGDFASGAVEFIGGAIGSFLEFTGIGSVIQGTLSTIGGAFGNLWDTIKSIVSGIGGFIERVLSFAENWLGIKRTVEEPVQATIEVSTSEPALAASRFYDEITKAVDKVKDLGQEGFQAALQYQQRLEEIAQLEKEGELTKEQATAAVKAQTAAFEQQIKPIEESVKAREKAAEEAQRAAERQVEADKKIADEMIRRQEIEEQFGSSNMDKRLKAQENILALSRQIAAAEAEQAAAQAAGNDEAAISAARRLAALDQALEGEQQTLRFGFNQQDVNDSIKKVRDELDENMTDAEIELNPTGAEKLTETIRSLESDLQMNLITPEQFEDAAKKAQKLFDAQTKNEEKLKELRDKLFEESASIQAGRLLELSKVSSEKLEANDIRTSEGSSEYIRLATGREDPAIDEYRKQLRKLEDIRKQIAKQERAAVEIA